MAKYTTISGDTWDIISKRVYDNELFLNVLITANIEHSKTVIFPAGVELEIPDIDITSTKYDANLPPWKRIGGA